jgi:hypothetical protein
MPESLDKTETEREGKMSNGMCSFVTELSAVLVAVVLFSGYSMGDSIKIEGNTYDDVYVINGPSFYYVCIPSDGTTMNIDKSKVKDGDVTITEESGKRQALKALWGRNRILERRQPDQMPQRAKETQSEKPIIPQASSDTTPQGTQSSTGLAVAQDKEPSYSSGIRKAAEQGDADAQRELGRLYVFGRGVPKDEVEAAKWYRKAADQGDANAQRNLAILYVLRQGVP